MCSNILACFMRGRKCDIWNFMANLRISEKWLPNIQKIFENLVYFLFYVEIKIQQINV